MPQRQPKTSKTASRRRGKFFQSTQLTILTLSYILAFTTMVTGAIYEANPPILNKFQHASLNQFIGKFILRTQRAGENGAKEDQFKSCTATLIAPRWILSAAHCLRRELGVPEKPASETRFRIYPDPKDVSNYTSYHLTGRKIIGDFPNAKHEDWAFYELKETIVRPFYPPVLSTTLQQWKDLNDAVFFVGFMQLTPDAASTNIYSSRQIRTSKFNCETSAFSENIFITYPRFVVQKGILEADNALFGASNCPSTVTSSGAPLFDLDGNIRAIDSFGSNNNQVPYFGEHKVNIHILSASFFEAYQSIIQETSGRATSTAMATTNLNMRTGPGTSFTVLTQIPVNDRVTIEHCNDTADWCLVTHGPYAGWVAAEFLQNN